MTKQSRVRPKGSRGGAEGGGHLVAGIVSSVLAMLWLGLPLAASISDIFIPLFWARRPLIQATVLVLISILGGLVLAPSIRKFAVRARDAYGPINRAAWLAVATCLTVAALGVLTHAAAFRSEVTALATLSGPRASVYPTPGYEVEFAFAFVLALFLSMVHSDLIGRGLDAEQRLHFALGFLAVCFLGIYFVNNILPAIDPTRTRGGMDFNFPHAYGNILPIGADFRAGVYLPAQQLAAGQTLGPSTVYPPLVAVLGLIYLLLNADAAYIMHVFLLVLANAACLVLAAALAYRAATEGKRVERSDARLIHVTVLLLAGFSLFTGYPFFFSVERGNTDIIASFLGIAAIWIAAQRRDSVWVPAVLLSVAVHIKVYPVLLFPILLYIQGRRIIVPSVVTNLALLFVRGPGDAIRFVNDLQHHYLPPLLTVNHSAHSFSHLLATGLGLPAAAPPLRWLFTALPLLLWAIGWLAILRLHDRKQASIAAFMLTMPVTSLVPGISYDYQLVVLSAAIVILLSGQLVRMARRQDPSDYLFLVVISGLVLAVGRWDGLMASWSAFARNKYLWVLLLQAAMLLGVLQDVKAERGNRDTRHQRNPAAAS